MRVRFTMDFRGKLTREQYYLRGAEVDFDDAIAVQLIAAGYAEPVEANKPEADDRNARGRKRNGHGN